MLLGTRLGLQLQIRSLFEGRGKRWSWCYTLFLPLDFRRPSLLGSWEGERGEGGGGVMLMGMT